MIKYDSFFVKSLGWCENERYLCIAMEYMEHGDLRRNLQSRSPLSEQEIQQITIQILMGLQHLHDNGYIHRDLKPENVLVMSKGPNWWVKISDFGISKRFDENNTDTRIGTPGYMAPERLKLYPPGTEHLRPTYSMDIWSLGIMVFHMLFNCYPFPGNSLMSYLQTSIFPSIALSPSVNPDALSFCKSLLAADALTRPSAKGALENTWLKQDQLDHTLGINEMNVTASTMTTLDYKPWDPETEHSSLHFRVTPRNESQRFGRKPTPSTQQLLLLKETHQPISTAENDLLRHFKVLYDNGVSCINKKRYKEAEIAFQTAFERQKKTLGANHEDTLYSLHWLGYTIYKQKKYSAAEPELRQAYEGQKKSLGANHEDTLCSLHWLGRALFDQKKYSAAEEKFRQAYKGRKETLGANHEDTLCSLHWLGRALYGQKKYSAAEPEFRQAYVGQKKTLGANHEDTLCSLHWLGRALFDQKKYSAAEPEFRQAYKGRKETLGANHEDTLRSLHWLGHALSKQKKYSIAEEEFRQAYKGRKETLGANHEDTLYSLHWLGRALYEQKKYSIAEEEFRKAYKGRKETLGANHKNTLYSLHWLGHALYKQKKYSVAEEEFRKAYKGRKETIGANHEETLCSLHWLGCALYDQNKSSAAEEEFRQAYKR
ncbi:kinase-like protein [Penicillium taxi]|uniref:kinase-like protein n=1 Tax=Penicillium taxi TaxID=168475 RepID=UPI002545B4B4|nr:kinase-like protein [Penicillium taxi]KAJ5902563.1 kinase-like protein [Penicillium taxi]